MANGRAAQKRPAEVQTLTADQINEAGKKWLQIMAQTHKTLKRVFLVLRRPIETTRQIGNIPHSRQSVDQTADKRWHNMSSGEAPSYPDKEKRRANNAETKDHKE